MRHELPRRQKKALAATERIYFVPPEDKPKRTKPAHPQEVEGYGEAIETLYRVLGGGRELVYSPEAEQREVDLYAVSRMLWDLWRAVHDMPRNIAIQVWNTCPYLKKE